MPVVFSNPQFPNQVGASPFSQAYSVQSNFRAMIQEVCGWNSEVDPMYAGRMINNIYRWIIDMREWYGLKIRGQIAAPNIYQTGQCTATAGSSTVQGIGTAWDSSLIGQQWRIGFTYTWSTITNVDPVGQVLTIDLPFVGPTQTTGYMILQAYYAIGPNIKRMLWAVNQQQGWAMHVNVPQECLEAWDTWRQQIGWSTHISTMPPTPDGQYQVEIWPNPFSFQQFPFQAYIQPPDMVADTDSPVSFIRSDVLVSRAIQQALLFRPKQNKYYDLASALAIAREKKDEFKEGLQSMMSADNELDQRDVTWDYENTDPGDISPGYGATFRQSHDV